MTTTPTKPPLALGKFDALAKNYSQFRPSYATSVLSALLGVIKTPVDDIHWADVGAGTGIWTRLIAEHGVQTITAVEPSNEMRRYGQAQSDGLPITWQAGTGEATGLADKSADVISMASSFHWVDFDQGLNEFHRALKPNGHFVALWNPRLIEVNPLLVDIEHYLTTEICPNLNRVSSGRATFTQTLTDKLWAHPKFTNVIYLEGRHVQHFTPDAYIGVWKSVNDIQVQAGDAKFQQFLDYIWERTHHLKSIEATYLTRAWCAQAT